MVNGSSVEHDQSMRCGHSCGRCAEYFVCRLPACPDCHDRSWRRAHLALERLYEELVANRG
ncbi:MAG: hypothetical protein ACYC5Q_11270 [Thermoleophilia bacterium]